MFRMLTPISPIFRPKNSKKLRFFITTSQTNYDNIINMIDNQEIQKECVNILFSALF